MELNDWVMLFLTFVTGAFIGMFIYVTSFKPVYAPDNLPNDTELADEYSVIGRAYSDSASSSLQPTFRLLSDGSYTYIAGEAGNREPQEGKVPRALINDLKALSDRGNLLAYSETVNKNCQSESGGVDFEYRVVVEGESYALDTCQTALGTDSTLSVVLSDLWRYLDNPSVGYQGRGLTGGDSFNEWVTKWLKSHLDPDYEK